MSEIFYLSGPMTGIKGFNVQAFKEAAANLRAQGVTVHSPLDDLSFATLCEMQASADGRSETGTNWGTKVGGSISHVANNCAGVILLPNWSLSKGSKLETHTALLCGQKIGMYLSVAPFVKWESVDAIVAGLKGSLK